MLAVQKVSVRMSLDIGCLHNPLSNDKLSDLTKLKAFADDKINVSKLRFFLGKGRKHSEKRRKCWLPAFSAFLTMFSKASFTRGVKTKDCLGKG